MKTETRKMTAIVTVTLVAAITLMLVFFNKRKNNSQEIAGLYNPILRQTGIPVSSEQGYEEKNKQVDALFDNWNKKGSPGYAIGIIKDGRFVYEKGFGMANLDYDIPLTSNSVFYVASLSKQFTAACIALLVLNNKISLEDDIHKYVPEVPRYDYPVKIKHLIYHTSGLPDYLYLLEQSGYNIRGFYNNDDAIRIIRKQKRLNFKPGARYEYNNVGYIILTRIVEKVGGMSFPDFAQKNLFEPLNMTNSSFNEDHTAVIKNRVTGYERKKEVNSFHAINKNWATMGGDGLYTTVRDLAAWAQNLHYPGKEGEEFKKLMFVRGKFNNGEEQNYSFGLVHKTFNGHQMIRHDGGFFGFSTELRTFPGLNLTIICLSNMTDGNAAEFANKISSIFLSQ